MKLKEFLKEYYGSTKEVTMKSELIGHVLKELVLPGAFKSVQDFRKTLSWNLDRDVYYREAAKENNENTLYVTLTTGKMDFYLIFEGDEKFQGLLEKGLKKHKYYRKESLPWDMNRRYLFYSRKYE